MLEWHVHAIPHVCTETILLGIKGPLLELCLLHLNYMTSILIQKTKDPDLHVNAHKIEKQ